MKSGVYKIINKVNGKFYLGVTKHFKDRFRHHKSDLLLNKHHSVILQRAVNKYGIENFKFEIVLKAPIRYLNKIENWFIKNNKPDYNILVKSEYYVDRPPRKNSEQHKQKIKDSWTKERRIANGIATRKRRIGSTLKQETKNKIGKSNSKLTDTQVLEIRKLLYEKKLKGKEIAVLYNISPTTVSQINKNKIYGRIN